MDIEPFRIAVPQADLADLRARLERTRVAPALESQGWSEGIDPADSFHVVAPSLPGYGFSSPPARKGTGPFEVAGLWKDLMAGLATRASAPRAATSAPASAPGSASASRTR